MADRKNNNVVVIGLGRFGAAVAESLMRLGHDVLAIDESEERVQHWADRLTHVVQGDATDQRVLDQLGVGDFGHAVVAIGTDIEASVLSVLALSELGVPDVWAKANTPRHGRILARTGAHHVVYPEATMGERVAHLVTARMIDFIEFDDGYAIAKTAAPRETHSQSLTDSALRSKYGITVVGIKRQHADFAHAQADSVVEAGDLLIVAGPTHLVERFASLK